MDSYRYDYYEPECKFPQVPSQRSSRTRFWRFLIVYITTFFIISIASLIVNIVLVVKFIQTDNAGFEPGTAEFQLFKNSRFRECSSTVTDPAHCTAILDFLSEYSNGLDEEYRSRGYIPISIDWNRDNKTSNWCAAAGCFNEYTVIPSTARPGVIGLTTFSIWTNLNLIALMYLFNFLKKSWDVRRSKDSICKGNLGGIGFINWAIVLYTTGGNIVWWWINYAQFVREPVPNTTLSIYAWAATWMMTNNLHYHPFSCVLDKSPGLKRTLSWLLALLSAAQWGATIHVFVVGRTVVFGSPGIYQGYNCAESMITQASGTAQCSAQRLCSDAALLGNLPFVYTDTEQVISGASVVVFGLLSLTALQPIVYATWLSIEGADSWSEKFKEGDIEPLVGSVVAGLSGAVFSGIAAAIGVYLLLDTNREAPIVADPYCNAVHVGLSSWRYYLDLEPENRTLRIVKSFFNA
ncbi:hypothetical protein F4803DRAFT_509829 [Xylaria telfairii]|nr:hypothetical protein F4803DRAFT_509829 [Xylaria telfairii]